MKPASARLLLLVTSMAFAAGAFAAEVFVTVRDDIYDPEVMEIEDGDTVTWVSMEPHDNMHNVQADDDSFSSGVPQPHPWQFSHTFNTGDAEIFYYDTAFGGPGGQGMSGAVVVGKGMAEPFAINFGITGSWYDPETDGQGFSIEVVPSQNVLVVYWFTYQAPVAKGEVATQMWLQGAGEIAGNTATVPLQQPVDGLFDDPQPPQFPSWGSATFTFTSCNSGIVDYESDAEKVSGSINIERITPDVQCEAGQ